MTGIPAPIVFSEISSYALRYEIFGEAFEDLLTLVTRLDEEFIILHSG